MDFTQKQDFCQTTVVVPDPGAIIELTEHSCLDGAAAGRLLYLCIVYLPTCSVFSGSISPLEVCKVFCQPSARVTANLFSGSASQISHSFFSSVPNQARS